MLLSGWCNNVNVSLRICSCSHAVWRRLCETSQRALLQWTATSHWCTWQWALQRTALLRRTVLPPATARTRQSRQAVGYYTITAITSLLLLCPLLVVKSWPRSCRTGILQAHARRQQLSWPWWVVCGLSLGPSCGEICAPTRNMVPWTIRSQLRGPATARKAASVGRRTGPSRCSTVYVWLIMTGWHGSAVTMMRRGGWVTRRWQGVAWSTDNHDDVLAGWLEHLDSLTVTCTDQALPVYLHSTDYSIRFRPQHGADPWRVSLTWRPRDSELYWPGCLFTWKHTAHLCTIHTTRPDATKLSVCIRLRELGQWWSLGILNESGSVNWVDDDPWESWTNVGQCLRQCS